MPVGLKPLPTLNPVPGIRLGTTSAGIRKSGRRDLVVIEISPGANCAAVFTSNRFCAAPVVVAREHLAAQAPRYLLINTGCANAGTGAAGLVDARACCEALAQLSGCSEREVLPFSTGVIGEPLPVARIVAGLPAAIGAMTDDGWAAAAHGIMTTDTVAKGATRQIAVDGVTVTITGIAKGAGMIRPDMATMLAYIATDARVDVTDLQEWLREASAASFNSITVDGDTSTNDACVLIATGVGAAVDSAVAAEVFRAALAEVCIELAQAIVRDAEGATKFITVQVEQGASVGECRDVAYTIAHSPLVKTALFASDPNWGRILAAIGRAGVDGLDIDVVDVFLDDVCIVHGGGRAADYREELGRAVMARDEILIRVLLGRGAEHARVWTCDFSYDYVRINAEYRT